MNKNNYCIIMAGGIGSRFWPMSRASRPKQFIDILGTGETLIQQTFKRFERICMSENILIVTNERYKDLILKQLPDIKESQVICEPMRRNTAPAIAYSSYKIMDENPNANVIVSPSDHIVKKENVFVDIIKKGLEATKENDWLLTLGIKPSRPDTGYGYIQFDENIEDDDNEKIKKVKTFTEKPQLDMAKQFLESGDFVWNSGVFIWNIKTIMKAFEEHLPEVNSVFLEGKGVYNTDQEKEFIEQAYPICKNISIDYGVMEKAKNVYVYVSEFGWSDLGTWGSLYENLNKDENSNAILGKNVMSYDSKNCIVNVPNDKLVVMEGLDDFIVVESDGILLICRKEDEQSLRQIVKDVKLQKGEQFT